MSCGKVVASRVAAGEVCACVHVCVCGGGTPQPTALTAASGRTGDHPPKAPVFCRVGGCRSRGLDTTATSPLALPVTGSFSHTLPGAPLLGAQGLQSSV